MFLPSKFFWLVLGLHVLAGEKMKILEEKREKNFLSMIFRNYAKHSFFYISEQDSDHLFIG